MPKDLPAGEVDFLPMTGREVSNAHHGGVCPRHRKYDCGSCGKPIQGRVVATLTRPTDGHQVQWCMCPCDLREPCVFVMKGDEVVTQSPISKQFQHNAKWPPDIAALYDEAAKSYSAGAFTACVMVCRKVLMVTSCKEGETDGKTFVAYVDHITTTVLNFPRAKAAIDSIRTIGNEATHTVAIVSQDDAKRAMQIVTYMLDTIYALPTS